MRLTLTLIALLAFTGLTIAQDQTTGGEDKESSIKVEQEDLIPEWMPSYVSLETARYYYLPDLKVYYDAMAGVFVYYRNDWTAAPKLPESRYGHFDLTNASVVPLDWVEGTPMKFFDEHQKTYPVGYKYTPKVKTDNSLRY